MIVFDIEQSLGFKLAKAQQRLFKFLHEQLKPYGITAKQWALLAFLAKQDGLSQTELAARMASDRATLGGMIDRLEAVGLVERRPCPEDRRTYRLFLTPAGRQLEVELHRLFGRIRRQLTSSLGQDGYRQLCWLLDQLHFE